MSLEESKSIESLWLLTNQSCVKVFISGWLNCFNLFILIGTENGGGDISLTSLYQVHYLFPMAWLKVSWKQCPPPPLIVDCLRTMSEQPCASFESACLLDKAKGQNVWKYSLCFPLALSSTDKSHIKKLNWWLKLNVHRYFVASLCLLYLLLNL